MSARRTTSTSRGGGIVLQPEVLEALRRAGVQYDSSIGVEAKERVFLDRSGGLARRLPMRQMLTSCTSLYGAMRRHFPAEPQLCPACRGLWQHLATPKLRHAYLSSPFHGHKADP
jgi:hypothetical protein